MRVSYRLGLLAACAVFVPVSVAEDGVTDTEILLGQSAALTGAAEGLGTNMKVGMEAFFAQCNDKGGIHGRKVRLISIDDSYEPEKTVDGTLKLIDEDKVFSLIGFVGTPTTKVAIPIVQEKKVPLVGPFTGAMLLRAPVSRYIFNIRSSYDDETEGLVRYLLDDLKLKKIAVFYQDDSFGLAGLTGTQKAMRKRNLEVVCSGKFPRNTLAVKTGLSAVIQGQPEAVIMVGPYKPVAEFVKIAQESQFNPLFVTISFVGTENLIKELGPLSENLVISQVVPPPDDTTFPIVREFCDALKKTHPEVEPNFVALEGFIAAKVHSLAMVEVGKDLTRERFISELEKMNALDIGGLTISFSKDDHQGLDRVFLTRVTNGKAKAIQTRQVNRK